MIEMTFSEFSEKTIGLPALDQQWEKHCLNNSCSLLKTAAQ